MKLLNDAKVLKIVMDIAPFYLKLVKEFIMNLSNRFNDDGSSKYRKVHV